MYSFLTTLPAFALVLIACASTVSAAPIAADKRGESLHSTSPVYTPNHHPAVQEATPAASSRTTRTSASGPHLSYPRPLSLTVRTRSLRVLLFRAHT